MRAAAAARVTDGLTETATSAAVCRTPGTHHSPGRW